MKYIEVNDNDTIVLAESTFAEAVDVALQLVSGAEYGQFDIDPLEACVLVDRVRKSAIRTGDLDLEILCRNAIRKLRVHVLAFGLVIDTKKG